MSAGGSWKEVVEGRYNQNILYASNKISKNKNILKTIEQVIEGSGSVNGEIDMGPLN